MKSIILLVVINILFNVDPSFTQDRWKINGIIDSFAISSVLGVDKDKCYIYGYRQDTNFAYTRNWFSSYDNWSVVQFSGLSDLGSEQYAPSLQASSPSRIYGYIASNGPAEGIVFSGDTGRIWKNIISTPTVPKLGESSNSFTVTPDNKAFYFRRDSMAFISFDGCKTFIRRDDSVFRHHIGGISGNNFQSVGSYDLFHWTVLLSEHTPPRNEPGLRTLVSANDGKNWKYQQYLIPGHEDKVVYGTLQSLYGTSTVFFVPGSNGGSSSTASYPSSTRLGVSFLVSTDFGTTWKPNYSFGHRRKAFYAVSDKELWMTVSSKDTLLYGDIANWIAHSTDGGETWDIDSTSLYIQDRGYSDGVSLGFYDNKHGWLSAMNSGDGYVYRFLDTVQSSVEHSLNYIRKVFKMYPNPASDNVTFLIGEDKQIRSIRLFDILGKEYRPRYYLQSVNQALVDLRDIPGGVYMVKLENQYRTYTLPFVVTKSN